jgi:hypothetical protein
MARMPTALLAWELGAGLGHLMQLRRMASRLAPHGMRFVAVVKEPQSAQMLAADGVEILSAPLGRWRLSMKSSAPPSPPPP